jgi:uncharacterized protein (TIGR02266 family)
MAELGLKWVRTLLAANRGALADSPARQHESGVHTIERTRSEEPDTIASLRLVPDGAEGAETPAGAASNRRGSERHPVAIELEFAQDSHFFTGLSQDISEGGIFVATYERLPIGTALSLTFETQTGPVHARGQVRWVRDAEQGDARPGIGIAFTELTPAAVECIALYCSRQPPLYVDF